MKHLKTIFACLLMAVLSIGQVWATDEEIEMIPKNSPTGLSWTTNPGSTQGAFEFTSTGNAITVSGTSAKVTTNYLNIYANGTMTFSSTSKIKSIVISATTNGTSKTRTITLTSGGGSLSGNSVSGSVASVTANSNATPEEVTWTNSSGSTSVSFTIGTGQTYFYSFVVTYESSGGSTKTLTSVAVSGTPTKTSYYVGDNFDPAGLTVTGTYSDETTGPITSSITWTYNPSQTLALNQTSIGVIATVGEIASPEFTVNDLSVTAAPVVVSSIEDIEDGASYYIRGVRSSGSVIEYLKFTDGTAGATIAGGSASTTDEAIAITFNKVSDGVYQLVTPEGLYVQPGASNGKIALSTSATTCNLANTTKTWDNSAAIAISTVDGSSNTWIIQKNTSGTNFGGYKNSGYDVTLVFAGSAPTVATPTISGETSFLSSTTVTITQNDAEHIYYTTDGSNPTTGSTPYSAPFSLDATATVKAIAVIGSDKSNVAEKTFTKVSALSTMAEVLAAATSTDETTINVSITDWVVTAVSNSQVWIAAPDNLKGILLYKNSHGLTAGKKLNGTVVGTKIKLYNLYPELTSLVASDVTVTDAEAVSPRSVTIPTLNSNHPAEQGTLVKLDNVTYTSSMLSDGVNTIAADNKFYSSLALVEGTTYNITGVVTYYKSGDDPVVKIAPRSAADVEAQTPVVTPTAANLAALKAAARGTYILTLENAVVTYVNGSNAFIEDATGGALIYIASHGYSAGDCLNGDYQVVTTDYQGKFEITAIEPQAGAATTTAAIPLTTVSIATLNASFSSYESRRVKIVGANVTDAISGSDRNGAISDGAALAVYAAVASTITLTLNDNVDIIGYPGFHNSDQQFNVWAQADITVNVKEDPELAYDPAVESISQGDAWSAPSLVNPHSLAIASYVSDNEAVATVEGGVIALAGGIGTATITAHTNGDATYAAGNATYTITVNEAGTYSMTFDLTRASYDDAADEAVVWNSSVATITATKGTGTKVTNYLAGNYSGTTLIAETRLYANNSLGFEAKTGASITKVEVTMKAESYASALAGYVWTNASAVVSSTNNKVVVITPTAATFSAALTGQIRIAQVAVYYTAESEKSKLTASIAIDDMNMAVGDDDILLSAIAATSNPNKKAISYAVTSGSEYVSITGEGAEAALHAIAEGTATVTATIPNDLGNYTGATTTFDIIVGAAPAALVSIAISGDASVLEYTAGQHFDPTGLVVTGTYSDASVAPIAEGIDWTFAPDPLTEGITSVSVTATVGEISSDAVVVSGLTVAAAPTPTLDNVVILAQYNGTWYAMKNTGVTSKAAAALEVVYSDGKVWNLSAEDQAAITWKRTVDGEGNVTFQAPNDSYLKTNGTDLAQEAEKSGVYQWTWNDTYYRTGSNTRTFLYRNGYNFRYYAVSNANAAGYSALPIIVAAEFAEGDAYIEVRSGLTINNYYTVCLPKQVTAVQGGSIWRVVSKADGSSDIILEEVTGNLDAGRPYIFYATADKLEVVYDGDAVSSPVNDDANGLIGSFNQVKIAQSPNNYIIYNNELYYVNSNNVYVGANRAYLDMTGVPDYSGAAAAPGRRRVTMAAHGPQTATGVDELNATEAPVKMMINGQIFILRGEKMYDTTGRLVK